MAKPGFRTAKQRHLAALLSNRPMSASELLEVIGGDKTTLKRSLESLKTQGLLDYVALDPGSTAPGRPAGLWSLTPRGSQVAAASTGTSQASDIEGDVHEDNVGSISSIRQGHTLVSAAVAPGAMKDLVAVLADGELTAAVSWVARVDGDGRGYLFAFDADLGDQPVENLRAALEAIGAICTVSTVRAVQPPLEFVRSVRTARSAAKRAVGRRGAL